MGRRGIYLWDKRRTTSAILSLDRFPPNFPRTRVQVVSRDAWFHIPQKFPLCDRICRKTLFLGYPICGQATGQGHGKRSATPTLFPSPGWTSHRCALLIGDFCWGMYRFPAIHLRTSSFTITITITITMRVFIAPYTQNRTGRHYNSHRMCVG